MKNKKIWGVLFATGLLLLSKFKFVLVILKVLKLQTLISMAIYLWTYALLYGWKFATAFVYLIFVHEMGHTYAARRLKLPVSPAIFIPFVGAAIAMKEMPKSAKDEAYLAYMGPVFGLLAFLPAFPLYFYSEDPFWALVIFLGGLLNLTNLIPITPLDGGRIAAGISTKLWALGLMILLGYSIYYSSVLWFIVTIVGAIQWYKIYKQQKNLVNDEKEVASYIEINEQLREHVQHASVSNFTYYARSFRGNITNESLLETFTILDNVEESETSEEEDRSQINEFLFRFNEQVQKLKRDYEQSAAYYKTDKKTKVKLFLIYMGLVVILAACTYYGNTIIMESDGMRTIIENG
nr:site-2 protease family protein [Lysinibacillus timonensis]